MKTLQQKSRNKFLEWEEEKSGRVCLNGSLNEKLFFFGLNFVVLCTRDSKQNEKCFKVVAGILEWMNCMIG